MARYIALVLIVLSPPMRGVTAEERASKPQVAAQGTGKESDRLHETILPSEVLEREVGLLVLLPESYHRDPDRRFATVYLLHGYGGGFREWLHLGIVEEATNVPLILVMPEGDSSFYANELGDPKARWEEHLVNEVVRHVDATYRTIASRENRAIGGRAMGGYGALMLGLRHPDLFGSLFCHSGSVGVPDLSSRGEIGKRIAEVFGPAGTPERTRYDLFRLARQVAPALRPKIYLDCGSRDFLLDSNRRFVAELAKLNYDYEYREVCDADDPGHIRRNLRDSLERQRAVFAAYRVVREQARSPRESISGVWRATVVWPSDRREIHSKLVLEQDGDHVRGTTEWHRSSLDFRQGRFCQGILALEAPFEQGDWHGSVQIDATLGADDRLAGTLRVLKADRKELFTLRWYAEPEELAARDLSLSRKARSKQARQRARLAGEWDLRVEFGSRTFERRLRFDAGEGALRATLIDPQNGEATAFERATLEDGKLELELELPISRSSDANPEAERRVLTFLYRGELGPAAHAADETGKEPSADSVTTEVTTEVITGVITEVIAGTVVIAGREDLKGSWKATR